MNTNADLRDVLLTVARSFTWVRETAGSNRGEVVDQIHRSTGDDPAKRNPWCAEFVAYIGMAVLGTGWPVPRVWGCAALGEFGAANGALHDVPAPGAIFLLWGPNVQPAPRFRHCGFVGQQVAEGAWATVEGNTNTDGSPDGTGVYARQRTFAAADRFLYWWEL